MAGDNDMKMYVVEYLGSTQIDIRFSSPMLPWIITEIKRRGSSEKVLVGVRGGCLVAFRPPASPILSHPLRLVARLIHAPGDYRSFLYLLREPSTQLLSCHLFRATDPSDVVELFNAMREQSKDPAVAAAVKERSYSSAAALAADISPNTSHYFEVLYIGKIKVSHKKVPDSFIDDALEKFRAHEAEKERLKTNCIVNNCSQTPTSNDSVGKKHNNNNVVACDAKAGVGGVNSGGVATAKNGGSDRGAPSSDCNEGESSCESGPQKQQSSPGVMVKLSKEEEYSSQDSTGSTESLTSSNATAAHPTPSSPLRGSTETIAVTPSAENSAQLLKNLPPMEPMRTRAASTGSARELRKYEHTASSDNRTMLFLVGRVDLRLISPDRKQTLLHKHLKDVASCIQGILHPEHFGFICREANVECFIAYVFKCESASVADDVVGAITQAFVATSEAQRRERMPVLSCDHCPMVWYHKLCAEVEGQSDKRTQMTILRRMEALPEGEQESILTKFAGAETQGLREQNQFLMMLLRAHCEGKQSRHVHDTAENRHEFLNQYLGGSTIFMKAKRSLTNSFDNLLKRKGSRDDFGPVLKEMSLPSNATLCKDGVTARSEEADPVPDSPSQRRQLSDVSQKDSPMKNIFLKVGNSPPTPSRESADTSKQSGSWRQMIFNSVTPTRVGPDGRPVSEEKEKPVKRDRAELRALWRKAINQQLLLIRMEKENAHLRARQEEATVKRIKLEYDELGSCVREVVEVWDLLLSRESSVSTRCDRQMLLQAIRQGVPRMRRGEVWQFLAEQHCLHTAPPDVAKFPNYHVPYESLLKQLTSHQHAILIDLGRTFPGHTYFARPLGPGQLSLFNLLKAYSLLDPEVGYCQGLSFVAGVLLLHMSEDCAYSMLRHLMLRRGLRRQYLPDMGALQVQLYQLSRLLHDSLPDLYAHFDTHDVAPTLYAAPWVLTLFASQFPLGFVVRVFDLLFFESTEVVVRVALALLTEHREGLLSCDSFEEIMEYLKVQMPAIDRGMLDRIMKQVFTTDVSKQLHEYEVEYHVLKEETANAREDTEVVRRLQAENRSLVEQLEIATSTTHRQQQAINRLEAQVRSLEMSITTMGNFISQLAETNKDVEVPGDVRRLIQQVAVVERRKSSTQRPKIDPPNVLAPPVVKTGTVDAQRSNSAADELSLQKRGANPHPLKSALSSPNLSVRLSGMSSFFGNSHNQIKQQQQQQQNQKRAPTGSSSGTGKLLPLAVEEGSAGNSSKKQLSPRLLESSKMLSDPAILVPDLCPAKQRPLRPSQSSFELCSQAVKSPEESGDSGNVTPTSPSGRVHPLDTCSDVNFCYSGTTKLKTIRPLRANLQRHLTSDTLRVGAKPSAVDVQTKEPPSLVSGVAPAGSGVLSR